MEGCVGGVPSFAISQVKSRDYSHAAKFAAALARQIGEHGLPPGTLLNVNVPPGVPQGAHSIFRRGHAILRWDASPEARQYKVQISLNNTFTQNIADRTIDGTSFAPDLEDENYWGNRRLYWRVAVIDEGGNTGGWRVLNLRTPVPMKVRASGTLRHRRTGKITVRVRDVHKHAVKNARVSVTGAGGRKVKARTNAKGIAHLRVHPMKRGRVRVAASKGGYAGAHTFVRVR